MRALNNKSGCTGMSSPLVWGGVRRETEPEETSSRAARSYKHGHTRLYILGERKKRVAFYNVAKKLNVSKESKVYGQTNTEFLFHKIQKNCRHFLQRILFIFLYASWLSKYWYQVIIYIKMCKAPIIESQLLCMDFRTCLASKCLVTRRFLRNSPIYVKQKPTNDILVADTTSTSTTCCPNPYFYIHLFFVPLAK